ncbi:MAG TPA: dihydrodipicolinate synthase family protein [Acidobacteriaceae bacterium]|jgi:dihydrodipicolinate synthase/N-acetylneuraminate lyase|nr:dihydrodipicolinate synthase family protein [Acidobacteriaceae bacterium]
MHLSGEHYNRAMLLEGIFPAITTPFYPDGRVYLKKLEHNVERYSRTPAAGIVVLGSTGEAVMLSDDESRDVLRHAMHAAAPEKVLIAGVGRESVLETLRLAEYAGSHQYDAILVRTPHYYGPQMGARALLAYYQTLADRSPLPIVLYSIPRFTHLEIPLEVVAELAQHPNIIAIKDSSGSMERLTALVAATRSAPKRSALVTPVFTAVTNRMVLVQTEASLLPVAMLAGDPMSFPVPAPAPIIRDMRKKDVGFQVLSGSAESLLQALEGGASGAVLAFGAPAPQACQEIYIAWKDNDTAIAQEKQERIIAASRLVVGQYSVAGLKHACDLNGYYGGVPRIPLLPLSAEQQAEVAAAMAEIRN